MEAANATSKVTVIFYQEGSLELQHELVECQHDAQGIGLPLSYRQDKSIIAVCEGDIHVLDKIGDRILPRY